MRCSITFDDGPSRWTGPILDLLADHDAKGTFFCCGWAVAERPGMVARAHAEGHEIGNHTYWHPHLPPLTGHEIARELVDTSEAILAATGVRPTLWRAPHFHHDERTDRLAHELGMEHVGATIDPGDWADEDAEQIAARVLRKLIDGSVIDLHDGIPPNGGTGSNSRQATVEALALILLAEAEFVTVSQL